MIINLRLSQNGSKLLLVTRNLSSQSSTTKPNHETYLKCTEDVYGPPDLKSNLRLITFYIPSDETPAEKDYRLKRAQVQEWNQRFWSTHNQEFAKAKEEFITNLTEARSYTFKEDGNTISPDDLSIFYKQFLDANRPKHLEYNREWHRKNFKLIWPGFKAYFSRLKKQQPIS